jgi:LPXTG-motif cell wall-anchored protein
MSLTALASVAFADSRSSQTDKAGAGALEYSWDEDTFVLDWRNTPRKVIRADTEFLGTLTAVPGDYIYRSLQVRNAGPSRATLSLFFRDWKLQPAEDPSSPGLAAASRLVWKLGESDGRVKFNEAMAADEYLAAEVELDKGEKITIQVGWELPYETSRSFTGSQQLSFGIRLLLSEVPEVNPPVTPDKPGGDPGKLPELPFTGADTLPILVLSALSTLAGLLLLLLIRRRRKSETDTDLPTDTETPLQHG